MAFDVHMKRMYSGRDDIDTLFMFARGTPRHMRCGGHPIQCARASHSPFLGRKDEKEEARLQQISSQYNLDASNASCFAGDHSEIGLFDDVRMSPTLSNPKGQSCSEHTPSTHRRRPSMSIFLGVRNKLLDKMKCIQDCHDCAVVFGFHQPLSLSRVLLLFQFLHFPHVASVGPLVALPPSLPPLWFLFPVSDRRVRQADIWRSCAIVLLAAVLALPAASLETTRLLHFLHVRKLKLPI